MRKIILYSFLAIAFFAGCKQSDPPAFGRFGDELAFSGYDWEIKHGDNLLGPGPNFFSNERTDIYLDDNGYLHLKIAEHDGTWYSTEVISKANLGFGTYTWTVEGDLVDISENVVFGLFTWDNNTFFEQANSEVDIEFSKWNDATDESTLQYGVQPIAFGGFNAERLHGPDEVDALRNVTTHTFDWSAEEINFRSFAGEDTNPDNQIGEWTFDTSFPAKQKFENGQASEPIVVPAPGLTTNARMNLWLLPIEGGGPANGIEHEVVIRSFNYTPEN